MTIYNQDGNSIKPGDNLLKNDKNVPSDTSAENQENYKRLEKIGQEEGIQFEKTSRGKNLFELLSGNYIVVGKFSTYEEAEKCAVHMKELGQEVRWGFNSQNDLWYDYIYYNQNADTIREQLVKIRRVSQLNDVWLLAVR